MRLTVACNFDRKLIERLKPHPVEEVFGKLPQDPFGGGRSSYMLAPIRKRGFIEYVKACHKNGIKFNYLLNAPCFNNMEFTRAGQKKINKILDWLTKINVDSITVTSPFLLQIIKKRYPHFKTRISVFATVDHALKAKRWEDLGADCVTLDSIFVNREFETLRAIRKKVKIELQLLVNNSCLQSCAMCHYHNTTLGHSSQSTDKNGGFIIDFPYLKCSYEKLKDPINYIRTEWIRPEDLHLYEEMGYNSFKIVERSSPTDVLVRRVEAYAKRRYDGNLLDLVQPFGYKNTEETKRHYQNRTLWELKFFFKPHLANMARLMDIKRLTKKRGMLTPQEGKPPVFIDNRKLDGFTEHFATNGGCRDKECSECGYCYEFTKDVVKIDEKYSDDCRRMYEGIFENLLTGKMWDLKTEPVKIKK